MADTFSPSVLKSGYYDWSNATNWSAGTPSQASSVTFSDTGYASLIDISVTIHALALTAGVTLVEAANESLTVTNGTTLGAGSSLAIGTNSYLNTSSLVGGNNDTVSVGTNAILTVANGMSFGTGTTFTTGASTGSGYVYSTYLTAGSSSTVAISDRLALQNGLTLGDSSTLTTSGTTADLELGYVTLGASDTVTFAAGTVALTNALTLGTGDSVTAASGVSFSAGSATLASGATLDLESGSSASPSRITTVTPNGGTVIVGGDAQIGNAYGGNYTIHNSGTLEITQNLDGSAAFSLQGGLLQLDSSVNIVSGTSFAFSGSTASELSVLGVNNFSQSSSGYSFTYAITGFDYGDVLQVPTSATFIGDTATYSAANHDIVVKNILGGTVLTVTNVSLAADVSKATFLLGLNTITLTCFLDGTLIETPAGLRAIETLRKGDEIVTIEAGQRVVQAARWVGRRIVDLATVENAIDLHPVRIRAGAFADGIPVRDLLVTPDHCILVEGGLVPARMLVNGGSIASETGITRFAVNHVEFDRHAILLSEGLTTESYLDTGNRDSFGMSADDATRQIQSWSDAAAPLTTDRAIVEPIWRRLATRAAALGFSCAGPVATTDDAQLRVRLQDGSLLRPVRRNGDRHFFVLPAGTSAARIVSRVFVPALTEGPFVDDRRSLGVAVADATLWRGLQTERLARDTGLPGWHAPTTDTASVWTDGEAMLAIGTLEQATVLVLTVTAAAAYLLDAPAGRRRVA